MPEISADRSSGSRVASPKMNVFFSPAYVLAAHSFETTRKSGWIADSLALEPIANLDLDEPEPASKQALEMIHDSRYVEAVRTGEPRGLAESQGFTWDAGLWHMVRASNGGAVAAARAALRDGVAGSLSSGLHHARHAHGAGFCTFNGLALAARSMIDEGARELLVLDLDAHCGGGTHELIRGDDRLWQADVSVSLVDAYEPDGHHRLEIVDRSEQYLPAIRTVLAKLEREAPRFDLCLYNAGMDPFEDCGIGGLRGISREILREREQIVFSWCRARNLPVAFVLAGGYLGPGLDRAGLVALHRLTLETASRSFAAGPLAR